MVRVKICGITSVDDAFICSEYGASAVGFVFYPESKRYITADSAREISKALPPFIYKVGVFVNEEGGKVLEIARHARLDAVQLHGEETPRICCEIARHMPVIKAFPVRGMRDPLMALKYEDVTPLFDTPTPEYGGSGVTFPWEFILPYKNKMKYFILSGGLNVGNVGDALREVTPFAVDVSSGVEKEPGRKDPEKVREFMRIVRAFNDDRG